MKTSMKKIVYVPLVITLGASYICESRGAAFASLPGRSVNLFYVYDEIRSPLMRHGSIAEQVSDSDDNFYTLKNTGTESSDQDEPVSSVDTSPSYELTLDDCNLLNSAATEDSSFADLAQKILAEAEKNGSWISEVSQAGLNLIRSHYAEKYAQAPLAAAAAGNDTDDDIDCPSSAQSSDTAAAATYKVHRRLRPVFRIDDSGNKVRYDSIREAAMAIKEKFKISNSLTSIAANIQRAIVGRNQKHAYGYCWEYADGGIPYPYKRDLLSNRINGLGCPLCERGIKPTPVAATAGVDTNSPDNEADGAAADTHKARRESSGCPVRKKRITPMLVKAINENGKKLIESRKREIDEAIKKGTVTKDVEGTLHFKTMNEIESVLGIPTSTIWYAANGSHVLRDRGLEVKYEESASESSSSDGSDCSERPMKRARTTDDSSSTDSK